MRLVWVALMAGCGFSGKAAPTPEGDAAAPVDAGAILDVPAGATCWELMGASALHLKACTTAVPEDRDVTASVDVDSDAAPSAAALGCAPLVDGSEPVCAIVAKKLTVRAGVRLTAHGGLPLAVLATEVDLQGAIDVSSRATVRGAGATLMGCNTSSDAATAHGGGAGGGFGTGGAAGGDEGGQDASGASGGGTLGTRFRGGCDGTGGGSENGQVSRGGAGGGAVWLAVREKLTLGRASLINASGAGGPGGLTPRGGGGGGGSGGLIVIQAGTLIREDGSQVFANGGHGGGGASMDDAGDRGGEPERPGSGGDGASGKGAHDTGPPPKTGPGGDGAKGSNMAPQPGASSDAGAGAGGGGGGFGVIWTNRRADLGTGNVSPTPQDVP